MKKRRTFIILASLLAAGVLMGIFALQYYNTFHKNNVGEGGSEIKIYKSMDYDQAVAVVRESGSLINDNSFLKAAKQMGLRESFKPGLYKLKKGMNNKAIVRTLAKGWQTPVNLVFPSHIRNMERLAAILSQRLEADSTLFYNVLTDSNLMTTYNFTGETFPAMFIPNTYQVYWTITPYDLMERMKKEYDKFWSDERKAKAEAIGLTQQEVSTLASIVLEESQYSPEQPTIAGVYINRLKKGMLLQADPTVVYALTMQNGERPKRVLLKHLEIDSPYNTYKYEGLPPGPITIPTIGAIDAVLNYERHNYLYFCAKETMDGTHNFASSLAAHNKNARQYQRAISRL